MKALVIALSVLTAPTLAQASFFQEYCSNGETTVRHANGHNDNFNEVTERFWTNDGPTDNRIRSENLEMKVVKNTKISEKSHQSCSENGHGWYSSTEITVKEVSITNADGSLFSERVLGVSKDRKSVDATLVCQRETNGETYCGDGK